MRGLSGALIPRRVGRRVIDDPYNLRSAAGVSIYSKTGIGRLQMNLSKPLASESHDQDKVFSVGLSVGFKRSPGQSTSRASLTSMTGMPSRIGKAKWAAFEINS